MKSSLNLDNENIRDSEEIEIFPIPTNGKLNIVMNGKNNYIKSLKIYNLFGKAVFNRSKLNGKSLSLDLSFLTKGIYLLEIYSNENVYLNKIVKN